MSRYTNIHSHVFTGGCAPDYFFKIALPKVLHRWADEIKFFLEKPWMRWIIKKLARRKGDGTFMRYLQFIEVGTQSTQEEVFLSMKKAYSQLGPGVRFVGLTLNMDHMDTQPSKHARIDTQLAEVERVRLHYPDNFFPFVGVDPRHLQGAALCDWVKQKVERGMFFGIKLYPSLGFFPFDPALDELYRWAAAAKVPVMTHCTRSGSFYTGSMANVLPHSTPLSLWPNDGAMKGIHDRVERFRKADWVMKKNSIACNVFLHPDNFRPVLNAHPGLKVCFAHFGGDDQMLGEEHELLKEGVDPDNFHHKVLDMLRDFPSVYADISYTLSSTDALKKVPGLIDGTFGDRILFGTDFFMTLREAEEEKLLADSIREIGMDRFDRIAIANTDRYLFA
ncbi:MAG: amidohydrolase family protein [Flavobacteriales bacterium]|nr:amidohydrolase family protein [Flavobacteriales bacterium]